jgi:ATP-binding cassette subfamily C protein
VPDHLKSSRPAASWRETIAYVPQDTFLFHDTIRANLTWVRPDASGEDINRA